MNNNEQLSNKISVTSKPVFLEEESSPDADQFVWAYHITIKNTSNTAITLRKRYWLITESRGIQQEISGPGVVGQEPTLSPGESFVYTSGAVLSSPSGIMEGDYEMECPTGDLFMVSIPPFSLDSPHENLLIN